MPQILAMIVAIRDYLKDLAVNETDKPENAKRYAQVLDVLLQICPLVVAQNAPEIIDLFSNFLPDELDTIVEIDKDKDTELMRWMMIYDISASTVS